MGLRNHLEDNMDRKSFHNLLIKSKTQEKKQHNFRPFGVSIFETVTSWVLWNYCVKRHKFTFKSVQVKIQIKHLEPQRDQGPGRGGTSEDPTNREAEKERRRRSFLLKELEEERSWTNPNFTFLHNKPAVFTETSICTGPAGMFPMGKLTWVRTVMEVSVSARSAFRIDALLSLTPPEARLSRPEPQLSPGSSSGEPGPRLESPPPPGPLLQPRAVSSSFLIRDILSDCEELDPAAEQFESGPDTDYRNKSLSSESTGKRERRKISWGLDIK